MSVCFLYTLEIWCFCYWNFFSRFMYVTKLYS